MNRIGSRHIKIKIKKQTILIEEIKVTFYYAIAKKVLYI